MTRAPIALAAVVLLAGCGEGGLDRGATETAVRASLLEAHPGATVAVDCGGASSTDGSTSARCTADVDGVALDLVLVERAGEVGYELVGTVVAADELGAVVAGRLADDLGVDPAVDCGPAPLLVPAPGETLRCTAVDGGRRHVVELRWVDDAGAVEVVALVPDAG